MRRRESRFIATSRFAARRMVEKRTLAPILMRQFELTIAIPPLNRRRTDLDILARHFLREANPRLQLDSSAQMAIYRYRFAGNVRELRNMMLRIAISESDGSPRVWIEHVSRAIWRPASNRRLYCLPSGRDLWPRKSRGFGSYH